jgi:hypothetical protein
MSEEIKTNTKERFFVDTNIIILYRKKLRPSLNEFIDNENRLFFYTETVLNEMKNHEIPNVFRFVDSELSSEMKTEAYTELSQTIKLSNEEMAKFEMDISIVFESSYCRFDDAVFPPKTNFESMEVKLLTNNLKLWRKFIQIPNNQTRLEDVINSCGFEHLIPLITPNMLESSR